MLLNYICTEQSVKILVQSLTNCKVMEIYMMMFRRLRSTLKIILLRFCGGVVECFVCSLFIRAVMVMNIVI